MEKLDEYDPRIIPGGRILRKLAIDELPQIFNVLRGEMSLVGPRPCIPYEADEYERWHTHRFTILPGLTGLWQVSGKNKLTFAEMIRLDIAYERNMSLWIDLWIIVRTIPTVIGLGLEGAGNRLARLGIRPRTARESTKAKRSEA
jgi:lipopolysaccharide/colanic/teichoic acid biosynthesis glycosyltransferase